MFEIYNYRIDWIDYLTGDKCFDLVTERTALLELRSDIFGEIISITHIINEEGDESENLLDEFRARIQRGA